MNWRIRGFVFLMSRTGYMIHHTRYLAPRRTNTCAIDWWHQDLVFLFFRDMSVKKPITRNIEAKDIFFFNFCPKLLSFLKSQMNNRHPWPLKQIKILGANLEQPAKQHCKFSPFWPILAVNRLNWQCCLAGSSKVAPEFWCFQMPWGADYSFELIFNETCAPQFIGHNNYFLASVSSW